MRRGQFERLPISVPAAKLRRNPRQTGARDNDWEGTMPLKTNALRLALLGAVALAPLAARAELAVSANDSKAVLDNGATVTVPNAPPDTVAIIDLSASPPKL